MILDLTVRGGMGGKEAVQRLREIDHDVRAVVASGYSDDPVMNDFEGHGFRAAVTKPYSINELCEAIQKVMEGDTSAGMTHDGSPSPAPTLPSGNIPDPA